MLYCIVETAKAKYLILYYRAKCMQELAEVGPNIESLLPWNFKY